MDLGQFQAAMLREPLPSFKRQVRHRSKIGYALMIDPLHDLPSPKGLQTHLLKQRFQLTSVQSIEITSGGHRLLLRIPKT